MAETYDLVNAAMNGKLPDRLAELRSQHSVAEVARILAEEGIEVSPATIKRWMQRAGIRVERTVVREGAS